ncbi:uncharacterized protein LOC117584777 isoform X1 [Drosophila guanche]|uniref:uncharacterized protein LOC117584777 isoform X1 n=1 Tax=Drosophila guanche TaxID=7266 RepID=UPI001470BB19|nr:uncharacterized protein LOC117584777 isoform X1 [Drosophila guanche]
MDILKKMFKSSEEKKQDGADISASNKDEFRKPQWFEEAETDDELFDDNRKFAFQVFTSPLEMQKHFERQMQRLLESMDEDGPTDDNDDFCKREQVLIYQETNIYVPYSSDDVLKPGFDSSILTKFARQNGQSLDNDLDGEIYADQMQSLIQRLNPKKGQEPADEAIGNILPSNQSRLLKSLNKAKLTDEELIMGRIHGTISADGEEVPQARASRTYIGIKPEMMTPMTPMLPRSGVTPFGGVFDGNYQGPKMFSQSVMTQTVRKPDGSYETTKMAQDATGHKTTTVTRMKDGRSETVVTHDGKAAAKPQRGSLGEQHVAYADRNLFVTKEGYAMPRNLW